MKESQSVPGRGGSSGSVVVEARGLNSRGQRGEVVSGSFHGTVSRLLLRQTRQKGSREKDGMEKAGPGMSIKESAQGLEGHQGRARYGKCYATPRQSGFHVLQGNSTLDAGSQPDGVVAVLALAPQTAAVTFLSSCRRLHATVGCHPQAHPLKTADHPCRH
jgi:hypothetical protein